MGVVLPSDDKLFRQSMALEVSVADGYDLRPVEEAMRAAIPSYLRGRIEQKETAHAFVLHVVIGNEGDRLRAEAVCRSTATWLEEKTDAKVEWQVDVDESVRKPGRIERRPLNGPHFEYVPDSEVRRVAGSLIGGSVIGGSAGDGRQQMRTRLAPVHTLWFVADDGRREQFRAAHLDKADGVLVVEPHTSEGAARWLARAVAKTGSLEALVQLLEDMKL